MSDVEKRSLYTILELNEKASRSDIKRAYRRLSKQFHPDIAGQDSLQTFQEISNAYAVLIDDQTRAYYDKTGLVDENVSISGDRTMSFWKLFTGPRPKRLRGIPVKPVIETKEGRVPMKPAADPPFASKVESNVPVEQLNMQLTYEQIEVLRKWFFHTLDTPMPYLGTPDTYKKNVRIVIDLEGCFPKDMEHVFRNDARLDTKLILCADQRTTTVYLNPVGSPEKPRV